MPDNAPRDPFDPNYFDDPSDFAQRPGPPTSAGRPTPRVSTSVSALAVISLVLGGLSPFLICVCYTSLVTSLAAIITGHIANFQIRRSAGTLTGSGLSIAGLVLGYITFLLTASFLGIGIIGLSRDDVAEDRAPGEVELMAAEGRIVSDDDGYALGNNAEARELARTFADEMKVLDETLFTESESTLQISGGHYVTWCELRDGQCAFIVHVPDYRNFDDEARDTLADLAWMTAQGVVSESLEPGDDLAVGLKGVVLYGAIMVGRVEGPKEDVHSGMIESDADKSELYRFFARQDEVAAPLHLEQALPVQIEPPVTPDEPPMPGDKPDQVPAALPEVPDEPTPTTEPTDQQAAVSQSAERAPLRFTPESVEEALEWVGEDHSVRQEQAVMYLGRQAPDEPNAEVVDALFKYLETQSGGRRYFVADALRRWVGPDDLERLVPLLDDENESVQSHVVDTISLLGTTDAAAVLAQRITETGTFSVSSALGEMGPVAEGPVLAQLQDGDPESESARYLINVLGKVGGQESLPLLERIATDVGHPNRSSARLATTKIERRIAEAGSAGL